ncbi:alkylhydroperoxidase AhpD family core domain protein [Neisseria sp. HMSC06F02]|jgi:4-carboxymuconolactone decarboxylase family protein|nr:alkylhydroperoxidase AhpD family core domain protein [Neisseria sp. HMSC06F02]
MKEQHPSYQTHWKGNQKMFLNWPEHTAHVKKSFGELGKNHPKMLQAYGALEQAAAAEALDAKTRELIALAVAITTRCESCISVHAAAAAKAGATESEIAGALATAISLNAGAAYTYALRALEAVDAQR